MIEKIRSLLAGKRSATPAQLSGALEIFDAEITKAQTALDALLAKRNDLALQAVTTGDRTRIDELRTAIAESELLVAELTAARRAAAARLEAARAREAADALRVRWAAARALVERRNAAGERLEQVLDAAVEAIRDVIALEHEIADALPVQPRHWPPSNWGSAGLQLLIELHVATHAPNMFARVRGFNSVDWLRTQPQIAARIAASGQEALAGDHAEHALETGEPPKAA